MTSSDGTDSETYTFKMEIKAADKISNVAITNKNELTITGTNGSYWFKVELKSGDEYYPVGTVENHSFTSGTPVTLTTVTMATGAVYRVSVYDVDPTVNPSAVPVYSNVVVGSF